MRYCLVIALLLTGCAKHIPAYISSRSKVLDMSGAAQDVQLPTELYDKLQAAFVPNVMDKSTEQDEKTKAKLDIPTEFFSYHVFLTEKTRGVLGGSNYDLLFGKGGGVLDLKDFVETSKGTFYLGVVPDVPEHEQEPLNVFFLSQSQTWQVDGETYGAGCGIYMDVSNFFSRSMNRDGIEVNVAHQRHVGLLAGTFFMAISIKGRLYLSELTVKDSHYKKFQCSNLVIKAK